jgi:hypothetical protein
MFDEFKKSIKASLYERASSPIIGAFISAWLIFNWKLCFVVVFANDTVYERLAYIEKSPYIGLWPNIYFPAISAVAFIALYPLASLLPYMWWEWYAKQKTKIKNRMQSGILLTLEKSIALRNELDNQEGKFEEVLNGKEEKISELQIINENLKKSLEEKQQEIFSLRQDLKGNEKVKAKNKKVTPVNTWPFPTLNTTNGASEGFVQDAIKNSSKKASPMDIGIEREWDGEYQELESKNPNFDAMFNNALTAIYSDHQIDPEDKKVLLVHGLIEKNDANELILTEKGKYIARKVV